MKQKEAKKIFQDAITKIATRPKFKGLGNYLIASYEFLDNYTLVTIEHKNVFYTGVAKRNPTCDLFDESIGLHIALSRACTRAMDKKDKGPVEVFMTSLGVEAA